MVNHGFSTAALFLIAGFMIARRGSARIDALRRRTEGRPAAGRHLPDRRAVRALTARTVVLRAEFLVLVGTFTRYKVPAVIATVGMILAAVYILWMYQRTMNGPTAPRLGR